jgi:hypothetical protein
MNGVRGAVRVSLGIAIAVGVCESKMNKRMSETAKGLSASAKEY